MFSSIIPTIIKNKFIFTLIENGKDINLINNEIENLNNIKIFKFTRKYQLIE